MPLVQVFPGLGHHLDALQDVDDVVDSPPLGPHLLGQVVQLDLAPAGEGGRMYSIVFD